MKISKLMWADMLLLIVAIMWVGFYSRKTCLKCIVAFFGSLLHVFFVSGGIFALYHIYTA